MDMRSLEADRANLLWAVEQRPQLQLKMRQRRMQINIQRQPKLYPLHAGYTPHQHQPHPHPCPQHAEYTPHQHQLQPYQPLPYPYPHQPYPYPYEPYPCPYQTQPYQPQPYQTHPYQPQPYQTHPYQPQPQPYQQQAEDTTYRSMQQRELRRCRRELKRLQRETMPRRGRRNCTNRPVNQYCGACHKPVPGCRRYI
ncbi:uncharacterized protein LOC117608783 isoform X2 [Osmia lignaria lignaria]|uniref:uncharacterized protein LOC117608783 isoform X2 n=1 Tax=Osmia lignaria lignaria TaxID=1437193 RepID=UPI00402B5F5B